MFFHLDCCYKKWKVLLLIKQMNDECMKAVYLKKKIFNTLLDLLRVFVFIHILLVTVISCNYHLNYV